MAKDIHRKSLLYTSNSKGTNKFKVNLVFTRTHNIRILEVMVLSFEQKSLILYMGSKIIIQTAKRKSSLRINMPYYENEHRLVCESERDIVSLNAEIFKPLIELFNIKTETVPPFLTVLDSNTNTEWVINGTNIGWDTNKSLTEAFCNLANEKFLYPKFVPGNTDTCKYVFCPLRYITQKNHISSFGTYEFNQLVVDHRDFITFIFRNIKSLLDKDLIDINSYLPNVITNFVQAPNYIKEEFKNITLLDVALKLEDAEFLYDILNRGARFSAPRVSGFGLWISQNLSDIYFKIKGFINSAKLFKEMLDYYSEAFSQYYVENEESYIHLNRRLLENWFELAVRDNDKDSILEIISDDQRVLKLGMRIKDCIDNLYPPEMNKKFNFSKFFNGGKVDFISTDFELFMNSPQVLSRLYWGATKKEWNPNVLAENVILDAFTGRPARREL